MTELQSTPIDSHIDEYCDYMLEKLRNREFPNKEGIIKDFENVRNGSIREKWVKVFTVLQNTLFREYGVSVVDYSSFRRAKILGIEIK